MWTPYIDHLDIKRIHLSEFLLYIVRSELNLVAHASRHMAPMNGRLAGLADARPR
jgi:hypothetical protein